MQRADPGSPRRALVAAALVLCLLLSVAAWWVFVKTNYETVIDNWFRASAQVSADGRSITVRYIGGGCGRETSEVRVDESAERVELTIVTKREVTGEDCPDAGVVRSITAHLEQSLGDRKLVDGHCAHTDWGSTYGCPR